MLWDIDGCNHGSYSHNKLGWYNPIIIATNTHANQEELQPQSTITMMMEITSMGNNRNVAKYSIQILALFKTHSAKQHYKLSSYLPSTEMFLNIPITSTNMSNCKTYSFVSKLYRHKIGFVFSRNPCTEPNNPLFFGFNIRKIQLFLLITSTHYIPAGPLKGVLFLAGSWFFTQYLWHSFGVFFLCFGGAFLSFGVAFLSQIMVCVCLRHVFGRASCFRRDKKSKDDPGMCILYIYTLLYIYI